MKKFILFTLLLTNTLLANESILTDEFVAYHLKVALEDVDNGDVFYLLQENINNLKDYSASNDSANELMNLIEEGYKIDPFNMSKLIETLTYKDASNNATKVIIKAIEYDCTITQDHMCTLIDTLAWVDASNNAASVIIKAIEHGIKFPERKNETCRNQQKRQREEKCGENPQGPSRPRASKVVIL